MNKTDKLIRQLSNTPQVQKFTPIATDMFLPNHSGDHSAGIVNSTPTADNDIVNKAYVDLILLTGLVLPYFGTQTTLTASGRPFLLCNNSTLGITGSGATFTGTDYYNLYAHIWSMVDTGDIANTYLNAAKGASASADWSANKLIYLPDSRGIFIRGAGISGKLNNAAGVAFSGTLGQYQNDSFQGHWHNIFGDYINRGVGSNYGWSGRLQGDYTLGMTYLFAATMAQVATADGTNGNPRYGAETTPANLSVNFIIKY